MNMDRMKFIMLLLCVEILIIILFVEFVVYDVEADGSNRRNSLNSMYGGLDPAKNAINHYQPCKSMAS